MLVFSILVPLDEKHVKKGRSLCCSVQRVPRHSKSAALRGLIPHCRITTKWPGKRTTFQGSSGWSGCERPGKLAQALRKTDRPETLDRGHEPFRRDHDSVLPWLVAAKNGFRLRCVFPTSPDRPPFRRLLYMSLISLCQQCFHRRYQHFFHFGTGA